MPTTRPTSVHVRRRPAAAGSSGRLNAHAGGDVYTPRTGPNSLANLRQGVRLIHSVLRDEVIQLFISPGVPPLHRVLYLSAIGLLFRTAVHFCLLNHAAFPAPILELFARLAICVNHYHHLPRRATTPARQASLSQSLQLTCFPFQLPHAPPFVSVPSASSRHILLRACPDRSG